MAALILSLPTWAVVIALIGLVAAMVYIFLVTAQAEIKFLTTICVTTPAASQS